MSSLATSTRVPVRLSPIHGLQELMWSVWLEGARRKEFYAFFILAFVFILVALAVRMVGVEQASTGTFVLNLGLSYCSYAAHAMVLVLAARMVPAEIENRTIYPILAKPVSRFTYILGKWGATALFGCAAFLALFVFVWLACPKLEEYSAPLLLQLILLQFISLFALSGLSILFSLVFPAAIALITGGLIYFLGSNIIGLLAVKFTGGIFPWLIHYIPNFSLLNLTTRYTDGIEPLSLMQFGALGLYGLMLIVITFGLSAWAFEKRPL
ncbi:MAG: ABC transporter permease [Sumerlaeia bacterium]